MTPLLSPTELQTILSRGEGQFVEFKSAWDRSTGRPNPSGVEHCGTRSPMSLPPSQTPTGACF